MRSKSATIEAFGRLHFSLANLSNAGEIVNGGAGMMVSPPILAVTAKSENKLTVNPPNYTNEVIEICNILKINQNLRVDIKTDSRMGWHKGLGFHTQLRLSIASAVSIASEKKINKETLAHSLSRGGTSGIGSLGFWHGGVLFDAGRARTNGIFTPSSEVKNFTSSPLLYSNNRLPFIPVIVQPKSWPLIFGKLEKELFARLTPIPEKEAVTCSKYIFEDLRLATETEDFDYFCETISKISHTGFKKREIHHRGSLAKLTFKKMHEAGLRGISMSSWGPTCFGFVRNKNLALDAVNQLNECSEIDSAWIAELAPGARISIDHGETQQLISLLD